MSAVLVLVVVGLSSWFYLAQKASIERTARDQLNSLANLKVKQIVDWRSEVLSDAGALADNPAFATLVEEWRKNGTASAEEGIRAWFAVLRHHEVYDDIALADPEGAVLLALDPEEKALTPQEVASLRTAVAERRPVLRDLYRSAGEPNIHLDVLVPLFAGPGGSGEPLGVVVLSAEVEKSLYAIIQDWPVPSDTGEILLVRREGDNVLYLNNLRKQPDAALNLTFPVSRTDLGAVAAVSGRTGIFEGKDYRGADIVAALRSIPDSPWFMVAKMDKSEAYAGGTMRFVLILALAIVLILAVAAAAWMYWQFGQKRHYREAYERESDRLSLLGRFEHLMKRAGDAILVNDEQSRIVEANDGAVAMYGYSGEEMLGLHVVDLIPPEGRADLGNAPGGAPRERIDAHRVGAYAQGRHPVPGGSQHPGHGRRGRRVRAGDHSRHHRAQAGRGI